MKWILIIYITSDLWIATYAYNSQELCETALAQWEFQPGTHGMCVEGTIEKSKRRK